LKKVTTILLSSLFISSMIFGGGLTTTVKADSTDINQTPNSEKTGQVTNTLIFKDLSGKEVGKGTVTGNAVGDSISVETLYQQKPKGYVPTDPENVTLQTDGSTQTIKVLLAGRHPFYGVVKINSKAYGDTLFNGKNVRVGAPLYFVAGTDNEDFPPSVDAGLPVGTEWKVYETASYYEGEYYYRAGNDQWINSKDATLISTTKITPESSVRKSDISVIRTLDNIAYLTKFDGTAVKNRALAPRTPWYTDETAIINGVTMYRVATNEWVKATDTNLYES